MFIYDYTVSLPDTDAAGLLFYGRQLFIVNEVCEHCFADSEFSLKHMLTEADFFTPVRHSESEYLAPLFPGDKLKIEMTIKNIGNSSVTYNYNMYNKDNILVGRVANTHVCIDKKTKSKIPLPENFVQSIKKLLCT